ncbi:unnamed protein product [Mytilus edulis]|uniref:SSD domain-containing protein n=1 Tax=Mytilus edulis TaxID=6550 RepID=A0A8S3UCP2_MYTED|nr:unnamed protein product [Mytilus edulis]
MNIEISDKEVTMNCLSCYTAVEGFIGKKFQSYGGLVASHPWKFIIGYILVMGLFSLGLLNLQKNDDLEQTFTPLNSQAIQDRSTLLGLYKDYSRSHFNSYNKLTYGLYGDVIFKSKDGENILNSTYLREIESVYRTVLNITCNNTHGSISTYDELCAMSNGTCNIEGNIVLTQEFKTAMSTGNIPYPIFQGRTINTYFGNVEYTNGILQYASSIKLRFNLRTDTPSYFDTSKLWIKEFQEVMKKLEHSSIEIAFAHTYSLEEGLNTNIAGDVLYFSITVTLMLFYAGFAISNKDCLSDRQNLARAAVLGMGLAIVGALGFVSACGVEFVAIVGVMPFLIIGIGLDDMFLLLTGLASTYDKGGPVEPKKKVMMTMRTSVAVLFGYLSYITFYLACITLNEKRVQKGLHIHTCKPLPTPGELEEKGQPYKCLCTGKAPSKRTDVQGSLEKYPPKILSKIVLMKPVQVIVIIIFAAYLGISIWGATNFKEGLDIKNLVSEDSYYFKYLSFDESFTSRGIIVTQFSVAGNVRYSDPETIRKIENLQTLAERDVDTCSNCSINWLNAYRQTSYFDDSTESAFINSLQTQFLPAFPMFTNDISFSDDNTSIKASRFYVFAYDIIESKDEGNFMLRMREVAASSNLPGVIAYSPPFIFTEQFVAILHNTLQTLGISVAAIFVITAIFLPHPLLVFLVTVTLVMILVGLIGFMYFWDLTLSSITMIHIVMSVGFSVDFSAHVCHGFMETASEDRKLGACGALIRSGGPIFNGAMSSLIGIIMLAFSKSYVFLSFFKVMILIILLGAAHSLFFLPVVLSLVGPQFKHRVEGAELMPMNRKRNGN